MGCSSMRTSHLCETHAGVIRLLMLNKTILTQFDMSTCSGADASSVEECALYSELDRWPPPGTEMHLR